MTNRASSTIVKIVSVIFVSATVILAVKYFDGVNQKNKLEKIVALDKNNYSNELKEILNRYDVEIEENKKLLFINRQKNQSNIEKEQVVLKEIIKDSSLELKEIEKLKFIKKIDSLKNLLEGYNEENLVLNKKIYELLSKNTELENKNTVNESIIAVNGNLTATNVYANGIKILSNNIIETKKFNTTDQIKVCFTLLENKATIKGNKDIYIQIINPNKIILNKFDEFLEINNKSLHYSAKTSVYYDNEELDVCVFVGSNKNNIIKGDYEINLISSNKLIGSTTFSLK